ncbi:MAG: NAD(P)H-hydrate dehydratase [Candidatus Peribacteraceae bacterium]|nr:NAD(P)H-hydrate dehydratase [Candidatus Peribacteraceae bacterium]
MKRAADSHKGENGKVAIIGGSLHQHGAPLFSALAAEASGADLVYVALPNIHQQTARMQSLNFQVHPFHDDELATQDLASLLEMLATVDCAVIGPGLARTPVAQKVIRELVESALCPLVLDASALQEWTVMAATGKTAVLTPHLGELERMGVHLKTVGPVAKKAGLTIHVKAKIDHIAGPDGKIQKVSGGNAGLTVGGTGDALAGLIAGLISQGMQPMDACMKASTVIKRGGTLLFHEFGYAYGTTRVIEQIPHILKTL